MNENQRTAYNFRRIRLSKNLTQAEVAQLAGVSNGYIGQIETAKSPLSSRARAKFAKLFNVDVGEFLRSGDPETAMDKELDALRDELRKFGIEKIKTLRTILPMLTEMIPEKSGGKSETIRRKKRTRRDP